MTLISYHSGLMRAVFSTEDQHTLEYDHYEPPFQVNVQANFDTIQGAVVNLNLHCECLASRFLYKKPALRRHDHRKASFRIHASNMNQNISHKPSANQHSNYDESKYQQKPPDSNPSYILLALEPKNPETAKIYAINLCPP